MTDLPVPLESGHPITDTGSPDYGVDAPGLVNKFFAGGAAALATAASLAAIGNREENRVARIGRGVAAGIAGAAAIYMLGMGGYMLFTSKIGKVKEREQLLDLLPWNGDETILDVGCGRGLMATAAAKRVPDGRVVGVDIWSNLDQSGNSPEAARRNARLERVADRVAIDTGDARELPFPDALFDRVVSHWVVHNLPGAEDRAVAIAEMVRVLKPGGYLLIADIEHHTEYAEQLKRSGFAVVWTEISKTRDAILKPLTFGSYRPAAVVARKL